MNKKKDLSKEDINTRNTYIKNPSGIYDKDKNSSQNQERKERIKFELHIYTQDEAKQVYIDLVYNYFLYRE